MSSNPALLARTVLAALCAFLLAPVAQAAAPPVLPDAPATVRLIASNAEHAAAVQRRIEGELKAAGLAYPVRAVPVGLLPEAARLGVRAHLAAPHLDAPKSPEAALLFAVLIPGGGHLYAGETGRGLVLLALGVGVPVGFALLGQGEGLGGAGLTLFGSAIGLGAWIYGMIDAVPAARRANRRAGLALAPAALPQERGLAPGVRLAVRL
ncbi:MAG: hypothetical protein ACK41D_12555 [Rubricoccaceae bacterium]